MRYPTIPPGIVNPIAINAALMTALSTDFSPFI
jgi:hypothetical protein